VSVSRPSARLPPFDALVYSAMGLLTLLVGSWVPDDRLNFSGVPFDLLILIFAAIIATTGSIRLVTLQSVALVQVPLLLLGSSLFWSTDPDAGLDKLTTLMVSGNLAFILLNTVIERHGLPQLARLILTYLGLLLLVAIPYKIAFGFFDRSVNFFINGPIIFARLMCIAALLAVYFMHGRARKYAVTLFCLAILWTESKGPILAMLIALTVLMLFYSSARARRKFYWYVGIFFVSCILLANYYDFTPGDFGRLGSMYKLATGDISFVEQYSSNTSFLARAEMWGKTLELIPNEPFGIGLGAWDRAIDTRVPTPYAHNLFLELWSEGGVLLGSIAALPFLTFFAAPKRVFWFVSFCLFLAQMVSGDIADARFLMVFSFLSYFSLQTRDDLPGSSPVNAPLDHDKELVAAR
jgi:hypothetical protein